MCFYFLIIGKSVCLHQAIWRFDRFYTSSLTRFTIPKYPFTQKPNDIVCILFIDEHLCNNLYFSCSNLYNEQFQNE